MQIYCYTGYNIKIYSRINKKQSEYNMTNTCKRTVHKWAQNKYLFKNDWTQLLFILLFFQYN